MKIREMEGFELFKQGAEGRIFRGTYLGRPTIIKERFVKKYRHPDLDSQLTKERIKSECRAILRCRTAGIRSPILYLIDFKRRMIFMEYFEHSLPVKDYIANCDNKKTLEHLGVCIGRMLGKMHENDIIHGDLTTSNMILVNKSDGSDFTNFHELDLIFIDFGLSHVESSAEDKGVDLYVLERALLSTHSDAEELFDQILDGYRLQYKKGSKEVYAKFEEVRARGRKRTMVG